MTRLWANSTAARASAAGATWSANGPLAVSLCCSPELELEPGGQTFLTVSPGRPVTLVLALAYGEPLIHLDTQAAGAEDGTGAPRAHAEVPPSTDTDTRLTNSQHDTQGADTMHKDRDITGHFMHMTGRLRPLLGPADHGDLAILVLHRHDSDEDESDKQLAAFNIRSDSGGCHYALRKLTGSDSPDAE